METLTNPQSTSSPSLEKPSILFKTDVTTLYGYFFLALSAGLYGLEEFYDVSRGDNNFAQFFIHYAIAIIYIVMLIVDKSYGIVRSWQKKHIHKTIIALNIFLVSAYALNRELPVFEDSVEWLCVMLVATSVLMMTYRYCERLPSVIRQVQHVLLGVTLMLYLYMAIFVANFYIFGTIGLLLIGIGGHIFIPAFLFIAGIRLITIHQVQKRWVAVGVALTLVYTIGFVVEWSTRVNEIDRLANQSVIEADAELPVWVKVAQSLKHDWITDRILKSRLVYTVANDHFEFEIFPSNAWDEKRKHDPFVFLASGKSNSSLTSEDRIQILKAQKENRHRAEERLWSGDNLSTPYIVTDVDLYPELRLAYTEHYFNVRNNQKDNGRWWGNTEEAIYTFQLPEGSVVTSLSLWVNGKEEKAILTSRQKATEAYKTIVGVEMRDPSVVHWQEGNTVSVRVFPCTPSEERKFKIGITSPLRIENGQALYSNVNFRGPTAADAKQTQRVRILGTSNVQLADDFKPNAKGEYIREGVYNPKLDIAFKVSQIKPNHFTFDGYQYSLSHLEPSLITKTFTDIYLDINESWTKDEIQSLYHLIDDYRVQVFAENNFVTLTAENWDQTTADLRAANFSIFPFHHIGHEETSLVISKGSELSPNLSDIKTSAFAKGIRNYFASGKKVYLFNFEGGSSTYVRSLNELRAFHFAQGSPGELHELLKTKTFPVIVESAQKIVVHASQIQIEKKRISTNPQSDNAPDHLARLFAYNNIMRQVGSDFFKDDFISNKLVDEASSAYVVSPVSSLIVLETKEDYERFGIKDKANSLHNASKNSSGAVPEPHEWALIAVFLCFIAFQIYRQTKV